MDHEIIPGTPPLTVHLRRSARAKRLSLRVSGVDGKVTLTMPERISHRKAVQFAHEKAGWLRAQISILPDLEAVGIGSFIPVEGQLREVVESSGSRRPTLRNQTLSVPARSGGASAEAFLKNLARDRLAAASSHYSGQLGMGFQRVTLRDTRSRWGSCTTAGNLMYSWRLIMAPPEILTYVAAHEVAHLREMNHGAAFWKLVHELYGDHKEPRRWLRENGPGLHRYRFRD